MNNLPVYRCQMTVSAVQIKEIKYNGEGNFYIDPVNQALSPIPIGYDFIKTYNPAQGGYYILRDNGFEFYLGEKEFEENFLLI